jgi:hypothetical protein
LLTQSVTPIDASFGMLVDVDVSLDGEWVGLFRRDDVLTIRDRRRSRVVAAAPDFPLIRRLDADRVVLADRRTDGKQPNAWIIRWDESEVTGFRAGDGIADVLAQADRLAFTYFDEGIFGNGAFAPEGLFVFDGRGRPRAGYHSTLGEHAPDISDCYAACWHDASRLAFFAYTEFPVVFLDLETFKQDVHPSPPRVHGCSGISTDGDVVLFQGGYGGDRSVYSWTLRRPHASAVQLGKLDGRVRGLQGGRFLTRDSSSFTVVRADAASEGTIVS